MSIWRRRLCEILATSVLFACGGGDSSAPPTPSTTAAAITAATPTNQSATAGTPVPSAPGVRVTTAAGTVVPGVSVTFTATATGGRATVDRADQVSGNQVHVVYAIPSDGTDRQLDVNGTLTNTVGSFQTWLAGQTGGRRLRFDTFGGALDITLVRLTRTNAQMTGYARCTCTARPSGAPGCDTNPFAASPTGAPGYIDYAMPHKIMHAMGFGSLTAPHHVLSGHVGDDNRDLMYAGPLPWIPSILDVGKDDYFGPAVPTGALNLANAPFLLP